MKEQVEETTVVEIPPYSIELARGQRGAVGWTIKVRGKDMKKVLNDLNYLDASLKKKVSQYTKGGITHEPVRHAHHHSPRPARRRLE